MEGIVLDIVVIIVSTAVMAWLGAVCKQPIIIAYLIAGMLIGPWGLKIIHNVEVIEGLSHIGITLLLFFAGLVLHPDRLFKLFKKTCIVTIGNCIFCALLVFLILRITGFSWQSSLFAGIALMFSSTVLVIRLLPTTTLHHKHMGSFCIAILIAQDILAVLTLMFIKGNVSGNSPIYFCLLIVKGILFIFILVLFEQYILRKMMRHSDRYHEVLYMLTMAWGLGIAALAHFLGLPYEIGAFIGGVILARNPISFFLSEKLLPLRDFFLMFFFFVLGAKFNFLIAKSIWIPALLIAIIILIAKPLVFKFLFKFVGESSDFSKEAGLRLGQCSEFGLIIAVVAIENSFISIKLSQLIQLTIILSIIISSYIVVFLCPTPIGTRKRLQQD
ncbi:MAG: cation:proton antiporter [Candidatus Theseobacter exili]|nr:cation:proton antiporter [Candidatus Theseobacter exili]